MDKVVTVAISSWNTLFREGIRRILSEEQRLRILDTPLQLAGTAAWIHEVNPDIILYDPRSVSEETLKVLAETKHENARTKIILLLEEFTEELVFAVVEAGADGCVLKAANPQELIKAIYTIQAGELWLSRNLFAKMVRRKVGKKGPARAGATTKGLTHREVQIMELVGQGLSNKEIADRLYIGEKTVKSHLNEIYKKLQINRRVQLAIYFFKNHALGKRIS